MVSAVITRPTDGFAEIAGRRFHYLDWGAPDRPAVLLLHGFNQTSHSWDELAARAAGDGLRLVALDQRGHGDSDRAVDGDYGRESMADDPVHLADALGIERFAVIGMSMGAVHAILAAVRHPDRTCALVIVDYAPEVEARGVSAIVQLAALRWSSFEDAVRAMHAFNPRRSIENIRERLSHSLREHDGVWTWKVDAAGLAQHPRSREGPESMWRAIAQVGCPTLLVRGGKSDLLEPAVADRLVASLRAGELVTIPGAGHSVAGDAPDAFYRAVSPFLGQHLVSR